MGGVHGAVLVVDEAVAVVVDPVADLDGGGVDHGVGVVAVVARARAGEVAVAVLIDGDWRVAVVGSGTAENE